MKLFEQLINILVVGAIALTVVKTYLTANKIWSRKHEQVVSESVSVSAQLIGIVTTVPFLVKYTLIDADFMSLANMSIKLTLAPLVPVLLTRHEVGSGTDTITVLQFTDVHTESFGARGSGVR